VRKREESVHSTAEGGPSARRILTLGSLWIAISAAALASPGCYGRNCEGSSMDFGTLPGEGHMVNPDTWESSAPEDPWLPFPRQRVYNINIEALGGRSPLTVTPYLSADSQPSKSGGNYTIGAGNLALIFFFGTNHVGLKNDTCSDYFVRVVVTAGPMAPTTPPADTDASPPVDAGAGDAEGDAGDAAGP
jgi:hypothetical protein